MIPEKFSLEKRVALVLGTGRSWHIDLAAYLCEAGARTIVIGNDSNQMHAAGDKFRSLDYQAICIAMDMDDRKKVENKVDEIIDDTGRIDILVNNIDFPLSKPFLEMANDDWYRTVHGTLDSLFIWTQIVGRHMVEKKEGRVINISSILSERGITNSSAYCTANGGVSQFTRSLAIEWARSNITVNSICVGWLEPEAAEQGKNIDRLRDYITLKRFCKPDDIAAILVYLASSSSSYVTGQNYFISGGVMSHG